MSDLRTVNHWWWRPGWREGRTFYTWHLTFDDQPAVHHLAATYRKALGSVPNLDLVPDRWLHLTMQGVGFTDEVQAGDVAAIVQEVRQRLANIPAFDIELDRPVFTPEAIRWDPPTEPIAAVRNSIREAIGAVWQVVPEAAEGFSAHVTIAYANQDGLADAALAAIAATESRPAIARISSAELIILNRDQHMYEWRTHASAPLSGG